MIVLSTVNLQTRSVPISLRSVLRIVAAYISWLQSGHHAVKFSTWRGLQNLQDSSQDMLRILPIVSEKQLKVLAFA